MFNDTARELNKEVYKKHRSNARARKLYREWVERGFDRKMPFSKYLKQHKKYGSPKIYHTDGLHFSTGKYSGKHIGKVIEKDPEYAIWVLENSPNGNIGQEIIHYYTIMANKSKTKTITTTQANNNSTQATTGNYDDTPPWD